MPLVFPRIWGKFVNEESATVTTPPPRPPVTTSLKRCPAMVKGRTASKMCFPANFELKVLSPPCFFCFPVEIFVSPSKITQVPSQIIAKKFYFPVTIFSILLNMYSFIIFPFYFQCSEGSLLGGRVLHKPFPFRNRGLGHRLWKKLRTGPSV